MDLGTGRRRRSLCRALAGGLPAASPSSGSLAPPTPAGIDLYAHGLKQQGIDPSRLILTAVRRNEEVLWAMEEGLKAKRLGAVVGEVAKLDLTASRRLQLAAESSGVMAIALRRWRPPPRPTGTSPSRSPPSPGGRSRRCRPKILRRHPVWRAPALAGGTLSCRGAKPGQWLVEVKDGTTHATALPVDLAPPLGDRSLAETAAGKANRRAGR